MSVRKSEKHVKEKEPGKDGKKESESLKKHKKDGNRARFKCSCELFNHHEVLK